jgi:hypothetical protein
MAEIVAAGLTSQAPRVTGKPEIGRPEQRDRPYAGLHEIRRLAAARPAPIMMFVLQGLRSSP